MFSDYIFKLEEVANALSQLAEEHASSLDACASYASDCLQIVEQLRSDSPALGDQEDVQALKRKLQRILEFRKNRLGHEEVEGEVEGEENLYNRYCVIQTEDTVRKLILCLEST